MLGRTEQKCEGCGSTRIRRARTHTVAQRVIRTLLPFQPYACGDCKHRGWRLRPSGQQDHPGPVMVLYRRYILGSRRKLLLLAIVAAWLGWQLAHYILRE